MTDAEKVIRNLEKKYGVSIVHLDGEESSFKVDSIPTKLAPLDIAIGLGGIPLGYFTEIFSPEGVGKTTLALQIIARAQEMGLNTAFIDMEHRMDSRWATTLGVDLSEMYFTQPPYGEAALNIARTLIEHGDIKLVVIDSVPSLVPKKELEGETGDQFVGLQARVISQHFRQMTPTLKANGAAIILTNQLRAKVGGAGSLAYGPQNITSGGWSVKYYSSIRLDMRRIGTVKSATEITGQNVAIKVIKNSLAVPLKVANLVLTYGIGFDPVTNIIDQAVNLGYIEKSGAWYRILDSEDSIQGSANLAAAIRERDGLFEELYEKVLGVMLPGDSDEDNDKLEETE